MAASRLREFPRGNIDPDIRRRQGEFGAPPGFEDCIGWMLPVTGDEVSAQWTDTFGVDDTDAVAARAEALGGTVVAPPFDASGVRLATVADPQGRCSRSVGTLRADEDYFGTGGPRGGIMSLLDRERVDPRTDDLERVWRLPTVSPRRLHARLRPPSLLVVLPVAWIAVILLLSFAPAASAEAGPVPLWVDVVVSGFWLSLMGAGALAAGRMVRPALVASAIAGGLGTVLGYACQATGHHTDSWWLVETVAFAALTVLSLLALRHRTASPS